MGYTKTGLPGRVCRMDRFLAFEGCTFVAMRDDKRPAEVVRELEPRQAGG